MVAYSSAQLLLLAHTRAEACTLASIPGTYQRPVLRISLHSAAAAPSRTAGLQHKHAHFVQVTRHAPLPHTVRCCHVGARKEPCVIGGAARQAAVVTVDDKARATDVLLHDNRAARAQACRRAPQQADNVIVCEVEQAPLDPDAVIALRHRLPALQALLIELPCFVARRRTKACRVRKSLARLV